MSRWTGSWLSGPRAALEPGADSGDGTGQRWKGERLGLPESGPGAVAGTGRRAMAILVDFALSAGVAGLLTYPDLPRNWSLLAWFAITVVAVGFFGFTPGHTLFGLRVARVDGAALVGPPRAALRTALIFLVVPAVVWDADGRCLHDKASGTIVIRVR
ncbi:RDD family protein [Actinosynnema mirum]|uniref:RDD domain containing protein n=1 Tax=Actinosynnema mirum (strain ATCC 29888 / DSM 43827 / JCM 3225 / NBRC 14064 / NCIMB 13271 / NRRL B-12336 / IMRU 3971 / 101) TaxID=446462 RepID=C6WMF2_ACTMD|nr:RDD family protein [Actinosynnema mirum]ACU34886.1 RDD domain containing protein [Actinosynnema mirum DSM 43827]